MTSKLMRSLATVGAAVLLWSCAPSETGIFRDTDAPMGATARFDPASFSGQWQVVADFPGHLPAQIEIAMVPEDGNTLDIFSSDYADVSGRYQQRAPGELVALTPGNDTLVVMWVDEDFETAAIGTPSGRFAAVIDRDGVLLADREQAALDVMAFYGWDTSSMQRATP